MTNSARLHLEMEPRFLWRTVSDNDKLAKLLLLRPKSRHDPDAQKGVRCADRGRPGPDKDNGQ